MRCSLVPIFAAACALMSLLGPPLLANPASTDPTDSNPTGQPGWITNNTLSHPAIEALQELAQAPLHGLPQERYALVELRRLRQTLDQPLSAKRFGELLTARLQIYATDLLQGLQPGAFGTPPAPGATTHLSDIAKKGLARAIATDRVSAFFRSIEPNHPDYLVLQQALQHYQRLAVLGGWPKVPTGTNSNPLLPGTIDHRVPALRARLAMTQPLVAARMNVHTLYDRHLVQAVKDFQSRHDLSVDGTVGAATLTELNVPVAERIRQIKINLDRWRQMPHVMPASHIWVNVPEYTLNLQLNHVSRLNMRVVVGEPDWPTPMMHDALEHLVINPYWYAPRNITLREILPKVQRDPAYLQRAQFDVLQNNTAINPARINWRAVNADNLEYRFRQRPGKHNSLGKVKFIFPNRFAVYMHDTNAKKLFDKPVRALSHGCIRLEEPEALAAALLEFDRGWNRKIVSREIAGNTQKTVKLRQTLPVYLVYFTATVNNNRVYFHRDIYGHDARHSTDFEQSPTTRVAGLLERQPYH